MSFFNDSVSVIEGYGANSGTRCIMIQVYKEAFKARATSLRARRVAECF
jgi:hypothetical protein